MCIHTAAPRAETSTNAYTRDHQAGILISAQYALCGDINWLLVNTGVVAGASDPEVLDEVFGNVKETQNVYIFAKRSNR